MKVTSRKLGKENNVYIALTSTRTQSRAANKKDSGAVTRGRIDEQYDDRPVIE